MSSKTISNKVINALLEALHDVLDKDGKLSVIRFSGLQYSDERLPSNGYSQYSDFKKLINAMNILMQFSTTAQFEIGRKFSFYLHPFGTKIEQFIDMLEEFINDDISISIENSKPVHITIDIKKCPFCSRNSDISEKGKMNIPISNNRDGIDCQFVAGAIYEIVKNSLDSNKKIKILKSTDKKYCYFDLDIN